jgi:microsomal dipeptidase-like Zn-dependent dipeptidase
VAREISHEPSKATTFDLDAHPAYDIAGLNHPDRIYELTEGLLRRGYSNANLSLILGGNFQRTLQQIWS